MDEQKVMRWALDWIETKFDPARWCFHYFAHTRQVVEDVTEFAAASGMGESDTVLLRTAAWLHDTGYPVDSAHHEEAGAQQALKLLPGMGYSAAASARVADLIRATAYPRPPRNPLEELISDADLGHLGSPDFGWFAALYRAEFAASGALRFTDLEFWRYELNYLNGFQYSSPAAQRLRGEGLERNRTWVRDKVEQLAPREAKQEEAKHA